MVPIGKAAVVSGGPVISPSDTYKERWSHAAREAPILWREEGISVEIVDLRNARPAR